jgi:hypothetical protein
MGNPLGLLNFGDIGSGVSDLFGAQGDAAEGKAYAQAATIASQNAALEAESTKIQEAQNTRQTYQVLGAQQAIQGASGFAQTGSARSVYANSAAQSALNRQVIQVQGTIQENAYKAAAEAYTGQKEAAYAAQDAGVANGIGGILGGILGIFGI